MYILEGGHYYKALGPTRWSLIGWRILESMKNSQDKTMLFIDDVHDIACVGKEERNLVVEEFSPEPKPDFVIMESCIYEEAEIVLERLKGLPKKKRARIGSDGKWFVSGFPLTQQDGFPLCVLLDAGLTLRKYMLGFTQGINILPCFYEEEQKNLLRILSKVIPDFSLQVILYDLEGNIWNLEND